MPTTTHVTTRSSRTHGDDPARTRRLIERYVWFVVGLAINSFGIALITKAALGTSPISSIPYVFDLAFEPSFGVFTFIFNMFYLAGQIILLRRDFKPIQLLQVVANLIFSAFIDVSVAALGWFEPQGIVMQAASLLLGCGILAFGISVEVAPNVIVVPGEGIVRAISTVTGKPFGLCKVAFDTTLVCIACALSLLFFGYLNGLGAGTVVAAVITGQISNAYNRHLPLIAHIASLTRSPTGAPESEL